MRSHPWQRFLPFFLVLLLAPAVHLAAQTCPNPIDGASFFVRQQYLDFLYRQPTTSELNSGVNQINACGGFPSCVYAQRILISRSFWDRSEFRTQSRTYGLPLFDPPDLYDNWDFIALSYYVYLQRAPNAPPDSDYSGHAHWLNDLETCIDAPPVDVDSCYNHIVEAFLVSPEYRARFGC